MWEHVVELLFAVVNPARTAACKHRKFSAFRNAFQKLVAFFHNCKVCGKVCIKYILKAKLAECCINLTCCKSSRCHAEFFTNCGTNRRSHSGNTNNILVSKLIKYCFNRIFESNSTNRTMNGTLTTADTWTVFQNAACNRSDYSLITTSVIFKSKYILHVVAGSNTASTVYTLIAVKNDFCIRIVNRLSLKTAFKADICKSKLTCKLLQFTILISCTLKTVIRMVRKDKLKYGAACLHKVGIVCYNIHSRSNGSTAGTGHSCTTGSWINVFYNTNSAACPGFKVITVAECRNLYTNSFGCL